MHSGHKVGVSLWVLASPCCLLLASYMMAISSMGVIIQIHFIGFGEGMAFIINRRMLFIPYCTLNLKILGILLKNAHSGSGSVSSEHQ